MAKCPECGDLWNDGQTCQDHFHVMLAWELDYQLYDVHHLLVLAHHLQHPSLYSPAGLDGAKKLLVEFLEDKITPQDMRKRIGSRVDSGTRDYKINGTPDSHGVYVKPVEWIMHASDVIAAGLDSYYASVEQWAESVHACLRESGNIGG